MALVLDEHQVPELPVLTAGVHTGCRLFTRVAANKIMDLRAGTAGACLAHLPEIILPPGPQDTVRSNIRRLRPEGERFLVLLIDRGP